MGKKTVPGFIKPRDQEAQFMSVKKEISFHPVNDGTVIVRVVRGRLKRMLFSKSAKFTEELHLPKDRVFIYPGGLDSGVLEPSKTRFVCGCRQECHLDLMGKVDLLTQQLDSAKKEKDQFMDALNKLETEVKEAHQRMMMIQAK